MRCSRRKFLKMTSALAVDPKVSFRKAMANNDRSASRNLCAVSESE
jgi:hypothetical protein